MFILVNLLAQRGNPVPQVFQLGLKLCNALHPGLALRSGCLTDASGIIERGKAQSNFENRVYCENSTKKNNIRPYLTLRSCILEDIWALSFSRSLRLALHRWTVIWLRHIIEKWNNLKSTSSFILWQRGKHATYFFMANETWMAGDFLFNLVNQWHCTMIFQCSNLSYQLIR